MGSLQELLTFVTRGDPHTLAPSPCVNHDTSDSVPFSYHVRTSLWEMLNLGALHSEDSPSGTWSGSRGENNKNEDASTGVLEYVPFHGLLTIVFSTLAYTSLLIKLVGEDRTRNVLDIDSATFPPPQPCPPIPEMAPPASSFHGL